MATNDSTFSERRRGERVLIRIPLKVHSMDPGEPHINEEAVAVVVSRYGALIRLSVAPKAGAALEVLNGFSHEVEKFRVVWVSPEPKDGRYDIGVELITRREDFWGVRFPGPGRSA